MKWLFAILQSYSNIADTKTIQNRNFFSFLPLFALYRKQFRKIMINYWRSQSLPKIVNRKRSRQNRGLALFTNKTALFDVIIFYSNNKRDITTRNSIPVFISWDVNKNASKIESWLHKHNASRLLSFRERKSALRQISWLNIYGDWFSFRNC